MHAYVNACLLVCLCIIMCSLMYAFESVRACVCAYVCLYVHYSIDMDKKYLSILFYTAKSQDEQEEITWHTEEENVLYQLPVKDEEWPLLKLLELYYIIMQTLTRLKLCILILKK